MEDITPFLEESSREHDHLCPRQILGVRLGLHGLRVLQLHANHNSKRLLIITETDGCFVDGLVAATGCTVGHRTLRVEDYGKTAASFIDTKTGQAIRVSPRLDLRDRAYEFAPGESRHYQAQMQAYQVMPDDDMFTVDSVILRLPVEHIVSHPGMRVSCEVCGEEIMNEREIRQNALTLCLTCASGGYYTANGHNMVSYPIEEVSLV